MEPIGSLKERYRASMVLSGVGDAIGYNNGSYEFCRSGAKIQEDLKKNGGLKSIKISKWTVSDDTVMHLATAEALCEKSGGTDMEALFLSIAAKYKSCMHDMVGRAPGNTCMMGTHALKPSLPKGYQIPFNGRGGGCGAAMRAMCIGLRYPRPEELNKLIEVGVESGRMTHHNPTGYLGSMAAALFTAYTIQGKPLKEWGAGLLEAVDKAKLYVQSQGHAVQESMDTWDYFENAWKQYLSQRGILDGKSEPAFPNNYDVKVRDEFYKSVSFSGWGGSSGHDAPMIAYDAFLYASDDWTELCNRAMFHGGDSDSTGVMAGAWYGAKHGLQGVPENLYKGLEYRDRLEKCGDGLYYLSQNIVE